MTFLTIGYYVFIYLFFFNFTYIDKLSFYMHKFDLLFKCVNNAI